MAKFRKNEAKEVPAISTGSMPDIIFMLIFFFMVTTSMRQSTQKVKVILPQASEVQKLEKKSLVSYIYIGTLYDQKDDNSEPRIQLNDAIKETGDIVSFIEAERLARPESERPLLTTSLKIDEEVRMGLVTDVKQELRKAKSYRINYSVRKSGQ